MKYIIEARNIWELGQRANQEDAIYPKLNEITDSDRVFVVCDGMGGHDAGEVASQTVCQALADAVINKSDAESLFTEEDFKEALAEAYDALDDKDTGAEKKMGTTMTFLKLHSEGYTIAHIGDSRVYHVRPGQNAEDTEILFQTVDHSLVNDLIKIGELTPEEAKHSKQKNVITRAMQPNMERRPRADIYPSDDIKAGDYFLLCTDGILEQIEDENIKFIFSEKGGDLERKTKMLIDVTAENRDNHSAILVHVLDVLPDDIKTDVVNEKEEKTGCEKKSDSVIDESKSVVKRQTNNSNELVKAIPPRFIMMKRVLWVLIVLLMIALVFFVLNKIGFLESEFSFLKSGIGFIGKDSIPQL